MKVIKEIAVAVQPTSEHFHDALMNTARRFQEQGLEVTINNPHLARVTGSDPKYMAVVEGRVEEASIPRHHKDHQTEGSRLSPFNTVPNRRI